MVRFAKSILALVLIGSLFSCATAYDRKGAYHRVREGESIWKIARYYHVPLQDLAEWNNVQKPDEIIPGLKLYIPRGKLKKSRKGKIKKSTVKVTVKDNEQIKFDRKKFSWPVEGSVISAFGIRNGRRHDGIDIKAESGTKIHAAAGGKVVFNGRLRGYGNMVILEHKDRFYSVYAHNSKNTVKKGQKVARKQVIGYVGSTGRATGPHLHFEVRRGDKARNPLYLLPAKVGSPTAVASRDVKKIEQPKKVKRVRKETEGSLAEDIFSRRKKMIESLRAKKSQ